MRAKPTLRRLRWQFGTLTVLALTGLAAIGFALVAWLGPLGMEERLFSAGWRADEQDAAMLQDDGTPLAPDACALLAYQTRWTRLSLVALALERQHLVDLGRARQVVELALPHCRLPPGGLAELTGLDRLERLNLDGTRPDAKGLAALAKLPALRALSADSCELEDAELRALAEISTLEEVNLTGNPIDTRAATHLILLPRLKRLDLNSTRVGNSFTEVILRMPALVEIDLSGTNYDGEALETLRGLAPGVKVIDDSPVGEDL